MIKTILVMCCLASLSMCYGQQKVAGLKKKHFGQYEGIVDGHKFLQDTTVIRIDQVKVEVKLDAHQFVRKMGRYEQVGKYKVLFKDKSNYVIEATFDNNPIKEQWMLNEKSKTLLRDGFQNQAVIRLSHKKT